MLIFNIDIKIQKLPRVRFVFVWIGMAL